MGLCGELWKHGVEKQLGARPCVCQPVPKGMLTSTPAHQTSSQSTQLTKTSWGEVQETEKVEVKSLAGRALQGSPTVTVCLLTSLFWVGAGPRASSPDLLPQLLQVWGSCVVEAASVSPRLEKDRHHHCALWAPLCPFMLTPMAGLLTCRCSSLAGEHGPNLA